MKTTVKKALCLLIPFGLIATLQGCGEVGGGASVIPNVTVKLADSEGGSVTLGGGTTPEDNGEDLGDGPGIFKGKVVLEGAAPTLKDIIAKDSAVKDAEVCSAESIPDERLVVDGNGGVKNVFIYLAKAPKGVPKSDVPAEAAVFDQKGCRFLPHCLIVRKGQELRILSDDRIAHNTHTFPAKNATFNSGIPANDREGTKIKYSSAESKPFAVKCDYHAWMNAYHLVVDHPYAAITAADGSFEIKDIPSGHYDFVIWHEGVKGGYLQRKYKVTVKAGEETEKTIPYPIAKFGV